MSTTDEHDDESWLDEHLPDGPDAMRPTPQTVERPVEVRVDIEDLAGLQASVTLNLTRDQGDDDVHVARAVLTAATAAARAFRIGDQDGVAAALRAEMTERTRLGAL